MVEEYFVQAYLTVLDHYADVLVQFWPSPHLLSQRLHLLHFKTVLTEFIEKWFANGRWDNQSVNKTIRDLVVC